MKVATTFLLATALSLAQAEIAFCPNHCKCVQDGIGGIRASCTVLNPKEQIFIDPVQHLVVTNAANKTFPLTDNIFVEMGLSKLESIKIVNSSLTDISVKAFQGLPSLFEVNLSENQLFLIHADTFVNNTNLRRLNLSFNPMQLTQLLQSPHEYLLRSSSLTDFDLSNCQLSQIIPKTFSQLKNLIFVTLSSNYLKTIPKDVFEGLASLEELDLSHNLITRVEKNVFKMNKELTVLKLRGNPIEALSGINARNLEELDLSYCKLRILMKESTDGMPELLTLNLNSNQIEVISDDSFNGLFDLKHLDLSNNKLIGPLPRDLFKNNHDLETLSLSGNQDLGILVDEPGFWDVHLPLTKLEVADCGLKKLTPGQLQGMEGLKTLNASKNSISELDESIFKSMKHLAKLDLSDNRLVSVSPQLFAFNPELDTLRLSGNPLKRLPLSVFGYTPKLRVLDAAECALQHLWDYPRHEQLDVPKILPKLTLLDLSGNELKYLFVHDFSNMDELSGVNLANNPLECVKSTIQVIEWMVNRRVNPYHGDRASVGADEDAQRAKWNELIDNICPVKTARHPTPEPEVKNALLPKSPVAAASVIASARSSFTSVDEIVVETDSTIMWPMVLAISMLIVALYFIIYLVGEITHRRRTVAAAYARPTALGGHVRTRGASGSPLYYKLYEECSIPTQPVKTKKNYILDFSPIHTILKKNTYKIMKSNNQANV